MIHRTDSDVTLQPIDKGLLIIQLVTIPDMKGSRTPNDRPWFFFANARLAAIFGVTWTPGTWMGPIVQGACISHNPSFVPSNSIEFRLRHTQEQTSNDLMNDCSYWGSYQTCPQSRLIIPPPYYILYIVYYIIYYIILYYIIYIYYITIMYIYILYPVYRIGTPEMNRSTESGRRPFDFLGMPRNR